MQKLPEYVGMLVSVLVFTLITFFAVLGLWSL